MLEQENLSIGLGNKTSILLCSIDFRKQWFAEFMKGDKLVRQNINSCPFCQHSQQATTYFVVNQKPSDNLFCCKPNSKKKDCRGQPQPTGKYSTIRMNDMQFKRVHQHSHLCFALYTFSRNKGAHETGGGCGCLVRGNMMNYMP